MAGESLEAVVVAAGPHKVREVVGSAGRITQSISDRVAIVELTATSAAELAREENVAEVVVRGARPATEDFDVSEQLFVDAWLTQVPEEKKQRSGEGLDWDAPGHSPP